MTVVAAVDATRDGLAKALPDRPDAVVSLLSWDAGADEPGAPGSATAALVQALADRGATGPLWCATGGAVSVAGEDADPDQAAVWGLGGVLALDLPEAFGGLVDLPRQPTDADLDAFAAALTAPGGEDQLAVRDGRLLARRLVRDGADAPEWTPRGAVLVTGGTGGLGTHVARWLARSGAGHVVLASRSGPAAPGAAGLAAEVEALGARCSVVALDVADRDAVAAVLADVERDGPLTAVVHAAGAGLAPTPVVELTAGRYADVAAGKVEGARVLDEVLADRALDAFVLFSSGAAVWGSGGQAPYAAANAFLDGLAARRRARGLVATSVAWGGWGGGLGMIGDGDAERWARLGIRTMDPEAALRGMALAVGSGRAASVVADVDWARFAPGYALARERPLLRGLPEVVALLAEPDEPAAAVDARGALAARLTGLDAAGQDELLADLVRAQAAAVLGFADPGAVAADRAFKDAGFDSVTAVELRNRLGAATGLRLPPTVVFDHPKPLALARVLRAELVPQRGDGVTAAQVAHREDAIRRVLASVPLARFEELGVLGALVDLVPAAPPAGGAATAERDDLADLAELDLDGLVRRAMRGTTAGND
ncbi:Malonyl CoA-acyl carrier protein transacylase [Actinosynnema pretiosum subsp. pretiosum]|nr:Malonyl CoA-acyl carrier protein transacylase [Actinosynnema pretiosum subsp. pretiosum]